MDANYEMNKTTTIGWTKQPNAILKDKDLTSDAKVIIYALLSISGDYHISESGIASTVNLSLGRVKKAIKLLKSTGYIEVTRVMNNHRLNGYMWKISDANGTFRKCNFRELENPATENPATENPTDGISSDRETQRPKTRQTENLPTYKYTEGYEQINNERRIDEQTELDERLHHQPDVEEVVGFQNPDPPSSFTESSSEANASPLSSKNTGMGEQVITQTEFLYRQLRNNYPPHRLGDYAGGLKAFQSIPDIVTVYQEIEQGLESWKQSESWSNEDGRYVPGLVKFLNERKWKTPPTWNGSTNGTYDFGNSDAYKAGLERWRQIEMKSNTIDEGE